MPQALRFVAAYLLGSRGGACGPEVGRGVGYMGISRPFYLIEMIDARKLGHV